MNPESVEPKKEELQAKKNNKENTIFGVLLIIVAVLMFLKAPVWITLIFLIALLVIVVKPIFIKARDLVDKLVQKIIEKTDRKKKK